VALVGTISLVAKAMPMVLSIGMLLVWRQTWKAAW
jgi:hypothetical protein